jgi:hypothetical protein
VSLRGRPVEESATLPDGREVLIRVGVPDDPYIAKRELDTVAVDLVAGDEVLATMNSVLGPEQTSEARSLVREIVSGLESGALEPTAGALEALADRMPPARDAS